MGELYEADDLVLGESVALKTIRTEIAADQRARQRFRREVQLARKVTHPNICRTFDLFEHSPGETTPGAPAATFVTMELLKGETVTQRLRRAGPFTTEQALPIVFMALVGLLWGTRGATLAAFLGSLIAIVNTAQHEGPFADTQGLLGDPELEVQAYAVAIALTGLLIAVLDAGKRNAIRDARAWQARFSTAIGAHRLIAYEWDPPTNRIVLTGDAKSLLGVPSERIAMLADWLALVDAQDREQASTRFDERVRGQGEPDATTYLMRSADGALLEASDEARVVRDHDGQLHRVVGIVRLVPAAQVPVAA